MKGKNDLIDLLTNEDFKRWVLDPTYERDLFWHAWQENNPEKQELVNTAKEFIRSAQYRELEIGSGEKDEILHNIIANNLSERKKEGDASRQKKFAIGFYKIAAAILLLISFTGIAYYAFLNNPEKEKLAVVKKENPTGIKSTVLLPDGTRVILNSESTISYGSDYGLKDRTVTISGEAFFDVERDIHKPFNVISGNVKTTALGTSFNVSAFENENSLKVSLVTGKVRVVNIDEGNTTENNILFPGEGFIIQKKSGKMEKVLIDPLLDYGWKDGILVFRDNDLSEVIQSLERWYGVNVSVVGRPEKKWRVDAEFDNVSLEQLLEGLSFTYDLEFLINGKDVKLKFN